MNGHRQRLVPRAYFLSVLGWIGLVLAACSTTTAGNGTPGNGTPGKGTPGGGPESTAGPPVGTTPPATRSLPVRVTATTGIVADLVRSVVAEQPVGAVVVEQLIPDAEDPTTFTPTAGRVVPELPGADLVVRIGLGYEAALEPRLTADAREGVATLVLAERLGPKPLEVNPAVRDPHVWLDPDRLTRASTLVADALARNGRLDEPALRRAASTFATSMQRADERVQATLAGVPDDRRTIVTDNAGLAYFTERYGFVADVVSVPREADASRVAVADALRRGTRSVVYLSHPSTGPERAALRSELTAAIGREVEVRSLVTDRLAPPAAGPATLAELLDATATTIS